MDLKTARFPAPWAFESRPLRGYKLRNFKTHASGYSEAAMSHEQFATLRNGETIARSQIPRRSFLDFRREILDSVDAGRRIAALFGDNPPGTDRVDLYVVLADKTTGQLQVGATTLDSERFCSMTPECPQAHLFEREIAEQYGVHPDGHPWFKPVRFHASYRPGHDAWGRSPSEKQIIGVTDYYRVEGEEIHEVAVGPVHAGVIEPGHFRFQCHGEQVFHLEISLGYQHRGAERTLVGGPNKRTIHTVETVAGDTSIGHATAYCLNIEALSGCQVPRRAEVLRGIALELERLANHTGDLGALAGDVGFLPTMSFCGRLRGDFLNLSALICGSRFGRGMVRPGGVSFDVEETRKQQALERLDAALRDVQNAAELLFNSASVQARFEDTGKVSRANALALGLVGPAARACGVPCDVRHDFPTGVFHFTRPQLAISPDGDVYARAHIRWQEIQNSVAFIRDELAAISISDGLLRADVGSLMPDHLAVSLIEGWRGEVCHVALTDADGRFSRYKIVDPSFHNWMGLAMALRDQQISDFPLCNKSFNLSYCGHDL
jgi:Ni,Fe-hydrogenase III large subunit/Ni,Fe-hydrogenase III component G